MSAPIVAISGWSGAGKTRLLTRLIRVLVQRGLRVGALKHTRHPHLLDVPGRDTEVLRQAGAAATAIAGPRGVAFFGPPVEGARALARLLPPVDLVLAEGFKSEPLPRVEVHRRAVSRSFLCARDPGVFAVVGEVPPPCPVPLLGPDEVERLADVLCARFGLAAHGGVPLRRRRPVRSVPAGGGRTPAPGRAFMPKSSSRTKARHPAARSRSEAGRKGGRATLRARGPEYFSEIGRKGGMSRGRRARAATRALAGRRGTPASGAAGSRRAGARSAARPSGRGRAR